MTAVHVSSLMLYICAWVIAFKYGSDAGASIGVTAGYLSAWIPFEIGMWVRRWQ